MSTDTLTPGPFDAAVSYGTAIRTTHIEPARRGRWQWTRTAPLERHRFSSGLFTVPPATARASGPGPRFAVGAGDTGRRAYALPAGESLASVVLSGTASDRDWPAVYRQWGMLLASLHSRGATTLDTAPPARARVQEWWAHPTPEDTRRATARRSFLDALTDSAREHLDDLLAVDLAAARVLVHGWAGLGLSVQDAAGDVVVLLGEDVGCAPGEYDLGALIAQSVELAVFSPPGTAPSPTLVRDALLDGYDRPADRQALADHTIEHVVRHVADFAQFSDFDDGELPRWAALVNWLDAGRRRLTE
ncbi:hypothetical protein GCM10007304_09820 [Rhodococcoides trifolii]|uniref:Uncharacterized protein n=1 Tax=Rhodococcoides trifolii TaxID=908250 RepID=A0A917CU81_9NOCA|nr:hypothetical protein [Rhodococcus trifolii]GGF97913.1 hypothetical protein GCM10007304_09820 [Rhodococcus trifolii]